MNIPNQPKKILLLVIILLASSVLYAKTHSKSQIYILDIKHIFGCKYVRLSSLKKFLPYSIKINKKNGIIIFNYKRKKAFLYIGKDIGVIERKITFFKCKVKLIVNRIYLPYDFAVKYLKIIGFKVRLSKRKIYFQKIKTAYHKKKKKIKKRKQHYHIEYIVIDPGHGGKDPGAIGYRGLKEKDIVLEFSKILKYAVLYTLRKKGIRRLRVYLTRTTDIYKTLSERVEFTKKKKINKYGVGIFISVHANAHRNKQKRGFEVYYLSLKPTNEEARETAIYENKFFGLRSEEEAKVLSSFVNYLLNEESKKLANFVFNRIKNSKLIKVRKVKGADFYVLRMSTLPSILVELGFITNPYDAKQLTSYKYQKLLALKIAEGIVDFILWFNKTYQKD